MAVRVIDVRERVMEKNDEIARAVRARRDAAGVPALNLVSSPGAGKTALLERTLDALRDELAIAIVTGDVQTQNDADRLARAHHAPRAGRRHRRRLPSRCAPGRPRARRDRPRRHRPAHHRERRQSRLPGELGPRRGCQGRAPLRDRRGGQAGEVSEDLPRVRLRGDHQDGPAALRRLRRGDARWGSCATRIPYIQIFYTSATTGEGMDEWCDFLRDTARRADVRSRRSADGDRDRAPSLGPPCRIAHGRRGLLHVTGVVQGVGFRPFVHRLAARHELDGVGAQPVGRRRDPRRRATRRRSTPSPVRCSAKRRRSRGSRP